LVKGDHTCTVADFSGTMKGAHERSRRKMIQATNKKFYLEFCTIAHWSKDGEILDERLFYDLTGMLKQIAIM
jgi:SnoaL-like polyketide cyclase